MFLLGLPVQAMDLGVQAAEVHHKETAESVKRGKAAEEAFLAQRKLNKATRALKLYEQQLQGPANPAGDVDLQSLNETLQRAQTRYDEITRVEEERLKRNAKKARKSAAKNLGTAKSLEQDARALVGILEKKRDAMALQGTVWLL
jgi:hypothetical protein